MFALLFDLPNNRRSITHFAYRILLRLNVYSQLISIQAYDGVCERTTTQVAGLNERWTPQTSTLFIRQINFHNDIVKRSCACRILESAGYRIQRCQSSDHQAADLALVGVEDVGHRTSIMSIHSQKMRVYTDDLPVGVFSNRYSTDAMQAEVADTVESHQAYDAEYKTQSLPGTLFRAIGFGLGIASLCVTAFTLVLAPVLVVEPNQWMRDVELFWIGVGLISLVAQLFAAKR